MAGGLLRSRSLIDTPAVLLFAPSDDHHADAVELALSGRRVVSARIDLSAASSPLTIEPGEYVKVGQVVIEEGAAVWWRRTGVVPADVALSDSENKLRSEESEALLIGGLLSITERWVDNPFTVMSAEHSLLQLAVAKRVGARVPVSLATNEPQSARRLSSTVRGPLIAKATSAGIGIAPHADYVDPSMFDLLPNCMTLLQAAQTASADVRVVVAGDRVLAWMRSRDPGQPLDWRAADPGGRGFIPGSSAELAEHAISINQELGLRFSVQDWLWEDGTPTFLEVNPSGQWLFLPGARDAVGDAIASLLTTGWS